MPTRPTSATRSRRVRNRLFLIAALACFAFARLVANLSAQAQETSRATPIMRANARNERADDAKNPSIESESGAIELLKEKGRDASAWLDPEESAPLRDAVFQAAIMRRANWPDFSALEIDREKELGIREVKAGRIVLYTDLPPDKEVDQIPEALEAAIPRLCRFFKVEESRFDDLAVEAFLMANDDNFTKFGALDSPPEFRTGYSYGDRIFAKDQKVAYYNRFLLTHELVHTIMHELYGDLRPMWFSEGAAEFLALHRWDPKTKEIEIALIPDSEEETPGFGRLRQIQELVRQGAVPTLRDVLDFAPKDYESVATYAWSWSLVTFLYNSPKYRDVAEALPFWALAENPNALFIEAIGDRWGRLEYDWVDYVSSIDYNYDFNATAIRLTDSPRKRPEDVPDGIVVAVDSAKGWQDSGVELSAERSYRLTAAGRYDFYLEDAKRAIPFEAPGATVVYVRGRPSGRLLAAVAPNVEDATFEATYGEGNENRPSRGDSAFRFNAFKNYREKSPRFGASENPLYPWEDPLEFAKSTVALKPTRDGVLLLRVNARPSLLKRNKGEVKVKIKALD